jgi:hypothetical protein
MFLKDGRREHGIGSKLAHYYIAKDLGIPVPEGKVVKTLDVATDYAEELGLPVYVSIWMGVGGSTSIVANTTKDIFQKFNNHSVEYLVTKYIPGCRTLSISSLIAKNTFWIPGYHDKQTDGSTFMKAEYPISNPNVEMIEKIMATVPLFLEVAQREGIRGLCGFNYIYNDKDFWFTNFISKPQCTVLYTEAALLQVYPDQMPLMELHLMALEEDSVPTDLKSLDHNPTQFSWIYRNKDYM